MIKFKVSDLSAGRTELRLEFSGLKGGGGENIRKWEGTGCPMNWWRHVVN